MSRQRHEQHFDARPNRPGDERHDARERYRNEHERSAYDSRPLNAGFDRHQWDNASHDRGWLEPGVGPNQGGGAQYGRPYDQRYSPRNDRPQTSYSGPWDEEFARSQAGIPNNWGGPNLQRWESNATGGRGSWDTNQANAGWYDQPDVRSNGLSRNRGPSYGDQGSQHRGRGPKNYSRSDERIREDICDALADIDIDVSEVDVGVKEGHVTLSGEVSDRWTKRSIEDAVYCQRGIRDCQNQIRIANDSRSSHQSETGPRDNDESKKSNGTIRSTSASTPS